MFFISSLSFVERITRFRSKPDDAKRHVNNSPRAESLALLHVPQKASETEEIMPISPDPSW